LRGTNLLRRLAARDVLEADAGLRLHLDLRLRLAQVHRVHPARAAHPAAAALQQREAADDEEREREVGEDAADGADRRRLRRRLDGEDDVVLDERLDQVLRLLRQDQRLVAVAVLVDREHLLAVGRERDLLDLVGLDGLEEGGVRPRGGARLGGRRRRHVAEHGHARAERAELRAAACVGRCRHRRRRARRERGARRHERRALRVRCDVEREAEGADREGKEVLRRGHSESLCLAAENSLQ